MRDIDPHLRWRENPFYVLGVEPGASELETEREGRKLLAQLELGLAAARFAQTPLGPVERTVDNVRRALSELRDPQKRRQHALWARLPIAQRTSAPSAAPDSSAPTEALKWPEAMHALGWRGL